MDPRARLLNRALDFILLNFQNEDHQHFATFRWQFLSFQSFFWKEAECVAYVLDLRSRQNQVG